MKGSSKSDAARSWMCVAPSILSSAGPRFHLFGPNVEYANRMESTGVPGKVQISYLHRKGQDLFMFSGDHDLNRRSGMIHDNDRFDPPHHSLRLGHLDACSCPFGYLLVNNPASWR